MAASRDRFLSASARRHRVSVRCNTSNRGYAHQLPSLAQSPEQLPRFLTAPEPAGLDTLSTMGSWVKKAAYADLAVALHDVDLDVLRACLNNLEQALDCELDGLVS